MKKINNLKLKLSLLDNNIKHFDKNEMSSMINNTSSINKKSFHKYNSLKLLKEVHSLNGGPDENGLAAEKNKDEIDFQINDELVRELKNNECSISNINESSGNAKNLKQTVHYLSNSNDKVHIQQNNFHNYSTYHTSNFINSSKQFMMNNIHKNSNSN